MNVNVYNEVLERVGIVMQYSSLIWDKRYRELGDCELYLPATLDNINLLQKGFYLTRDDDDMVCIIRKIEITTDAEQGPMMIVTGKDVKCLIDQRIQQVASRFVNALAEEAIRRMVGWAVINAGVDGNVNVIYKGSSSTPLVQTRANAALTDRITTEYGYGNAGDKIREVQARFGWGGRMTLEQIDSTGPYLVYETYRGTDRRASVIFKPSHRNLKSSDYVDDVSDMKNVTYVVYGVEGFFVAFADQEGTQYYGTATGIDRFEQIIDKRSVSYTTTKSEIDSTYPGGSWSQLSGLHIWTYTLPTYEFGVPPGSLRPWIEARYPGATFREEHGKTICTMQNFVLATTPEDTTTLSANTKVFLREVPYFLNLLGMAAEANTEHPEQISFTFEVIPDLTYRYKEDYYLGDLVTVENEFGVSSDCRIVEVLECWDTNGYKLELKFEE